MILSSIGSRTWPTGLTCTAVWSRTFVQNNKHPDLEFTAIYLDVCIVHPCAFIYLKCKLAYVGMILTEKRKDWLYKDKIEKNGGMFLSFVLDTYGGIGSKAEEALKRICTEA